MKEAQPFITELYDVLTHAIPRPVSPDYPRISMVLQEKFSAVLFGTKDERTAMQEAQTEISRILSSGS